MCRMLGIRSSGPMDARYLREFQALADTGMVQPGSKPGHRDGWGLTTYRGESWRYLGREAISATDPASGYPAAVQTAEMERLGGIFIVHLRKKSIGAAKVENTHPFADRSWCLAHNGTIERYAREGMTDSETLLHDIVAEMTLGKPPALALAQVIERTRRARIYTSLTVLFSDGQNLWAVRQVRTPEIGPYYGIYYATADDHLIVSQEKTWDLPWKELGNGELLTVGGDLRPVVRTIGAVIA